MHVFTFRVNNSKIHMTKKNTTEIANRWVVSQFVQLVVITFLQLSHHNYRKSNKTKSGSSNIKNWKAGF